MYLYTSFYFYKIKLIQNIKNYFYWMKLNNYLPYTSGSSSNKD